MHVCDLWMPNHEGWNVGRVFDLFGDYLVSHIYDISVLQNGPSDRIFWFHNTHGSYTTKSSYSWMLLNKVGYGPHCFFSKFIWKLKILPKTRVFAWRIGHGLLHTNVKLSSIKTHVDPVCSICRNGDETPLHALRDCPKACEVLIPSGFNNRLLTNSYEFCINWVEDSMRILDKMAFKDFISTLWNIWNSRNNAIFRGKEEDLYGIWECARKLNTDFRIHNLSSQPILPRVPKCYRWEKPPAGIIKVNVDAIVNSCGTSLGIIARDFDNFVLSGRASFTNKVANLELAELDALIDGFDLVTFSMLIRSFLNRIVQVSSITLVITRRTLRSLGTGSRKLASCLTLLFSSRSNGLTEVITN
ncbi:hypothetical protein J1N35_007316 [Gossypium stocksii]|uniref:Reverse transcriptase zinc-binding domain-containing protein n=1 Tax=Gossypium stocksii TaxID=47602 RepID=A0A9D4AFG2_9ROSI|nr:hypothetical protein J1N35_007316 [Gossypium stocksii]